jgi:hypothetical protein
MIKTFLRLYLRNVLVFLILMVVLTADTLAQTPQYYNTNTGTGTNTYPWGQAAGQRVQWLIRTGTLITPTPCPTGIITKLYFWMGNAGNATFTDFTIKMANLPITTLPSSFDTTGFSLVYYRASVNLTCATTTWMVITLDTPFPYDTSKALLIDARQCGYSGTGLYVRQSSGTPATRNYGSPAPCPQNYAGQDGQIINFGVDVVTTPMHYNYNTTGTNNSFPFGIAGGKMVQWLIPPAGQTGSWNTPSPPLPGGLINAIYIWVGGTYALGPATYSEFRVLMGQTNLTNLTTGQFFTGPMDTVLFRLSMPLYGPLNAWMPIILDVPEAYDPSMSLVLQIGHCGAPGATGYPACQTSIGGVKRVWSVGGCPYSPYSSGDGSVIHTGINIVYPTGVSNNNNRIPDAYRLEQNFPNPFNPNTSISFGIPKAGNVKLVVYDILGREVAVLVNEFMQAGDYTIPFDASEFASGVYMYKLESGGFIDVKKMSLVK